MRGLKFQGGLHDFEIDTGRIEVHPRLVAADHPLEFSSRPGTSGVAGFDVMLGGGVMREVVDRGVRFIAIDSLNACLLAMPGQSFLLLHMHELLSFLNRQGVVTMLIVGQHGLIGEVRPDIDLSYLGDTIVRYRFFEARGEVRSAISVIKSRIGANERSIRELRLSANSGLQIGAALRGVEGVMGGLPSYLGETPMLDDDAVDNTAAAART